MQSFGMAAVIGSIVRLATDESAWPPAPAVVLAFTAPAVASPGTVTESRLSGSVLQFCGVALLATTGSAKTCRSADRTETRNALARQLKSPLALVCA